MLDTTHHTFFSLAFHLFHLKLMKVMSSQLSILVILILVLLTFYFISETLILTSKNKFLMKKNEVLSQIYFHKICIEKRHKAINTYDFQFQNIEAVLKEQLIINL